MRRAHFNAPRGVDGAPCMAHRDAPYRGAARVEGDNWEKRK